eukprot:6482116-Amphidinium_carterae.4
MKSNCGDWRQFARFGLKGQTTNPKPFKSAISNVDKCSSESNQWFHAVEAFELTRGLLNLQSSDVDKKLNDEYEAAAKYLKLIPLVGKFVHVLLSPATAKSPKKQFDAAQSMLKEIHNHWGKAAEQTMLPDALLKKHLQCMTLTKNTSKGASSK